MTKYAEKSFSVPLGGSSYAEGWERVFGKKPEEGEKKSQEEESEEPEHEG